MILSNCGISEGFSHNSAIYTAPSESLMFANPLGFGVRTESGMLSPHVYDKEWAIFFPLWFVALMTAIAPACALRKRRSRHGRRDAFDAISRWHALNMN